MSECCKAGFAWEGTPKGKETKVAGLNTYVATPSTKSDRAILIVHDVFGWTFNNTRILADTYAAELDATVYLPDFFGGEIIIDSLLDAEKRKSFDLMSFLGRNPKELRYPEIQAVLAEIKSAGHTKTGAIGFCYGGWAVFQLAASKASGTGAAVNFIAAAHPSLATPAEIEAISVPVLYLAPETDPQFTAELKELAQRELKKKEGEYIFFPKLVHGFAVRGDPKDKVQREGLEKAMRDFVSFSKKQFSKL